MTRAASWRFDAALVPAIAFIVVLALIGAQASPTFLSPFNISNVLTQVTPLLLVAAGQTFVVGSGGIDLSTGAIVSLASAVSAVLFSSVGIPGAVAVALLAGLVAGLCNGLLVARGLDPFLATLGSLSVIQGVAFTVLASPGGAVPDAFAGLAGYVLQGTVPIALPFALMVLAVSSTALQRTRFGLDVLSVGSNAEVAALCGIGVPRARLGAYAVSGLLAAGAGLFLNARTLGGDPLAGATYTLDSIAAVVLGGSLLTGGRASVIGSGLGALALGLLANVLNFAQISSFYQVSVKGALVIAAVVIPAVVVKVARRLRAQADTRALQAGAAAPDRPG